tara:strand:+ start:52 stop:594 length:543 start_codon:yes stop_codon:yes gene_type:complete
MTQYKSPNSDNTDGSWTNKNGGQGALNSNVRKGTGDGSWIVSVDTGGSDTCVFGIQNGDDPYSSADHIVRYRAKSTDYMMMGTLPLTVALYQDTTKIAEEENSSLATSFTDYSFTLSTSEANAISDYDDLQLRFTRGTYGMMGDDVQVSEAYFEYPDGGTPPAPEAVAVNQPEAFVMFVD